MPSVAMLQGPFCAEAITVGTPPHPVFALSLVDLERKLVVAQDMHTRRVYVYDLDGSLRATYDALGPVYDFFVPDGADSVWMFETSALARRFRI